MRIADYVTSYHTFLKSTVYLALAEDTPPDSCAALDKRLTKAFKAAEAAWNKDLPESKKAALQAELQEE